MAASDLSGYSGSVTLPSGHGGAAKGFTVRRTMSKKNTSRYGADRFSRFRGGSITIEGQINIFLQKGAAGTSPGIVAPAADGASLTLTLDEGCTLTGTALFDGFESTHAFDDPAIEGSHSYSFSGTVTETWATPT